MKTNFEAELRKEFESHSCAGTAATPSRNRQKPILKAFPADLE
jgi:hypothetical protein